MSQSSNCSTGKTFDSLYALTETQQKGFFGVELLLLNLAALKEKREALASLADIQKTTI